MNRHNAYQAAPKEYSFEELINASELREFVFCERAWWLSRQGYTVSPQAEADRAAGVAFHEQRGRPARAATTGNALWWAIILALAAFAIWLAKWLMETHP